MVYSKNYPPYSLYFTGSESTLEKLQPCVISERKIRLRQMCDGKFDCPDLSDECLCTRKRAENEATYALCQNLLRTNVGKQKANCSAGIFSCIVKPDNGREFYGCIAGQSICDGKYDCRDGSDERYCGSALNITINSSSVAYAHTKMTTNISSKPYACNGVVELANGSDELQCDQHYYCEGNSLELANGLKRMYRLHISGSSNLLERNTAFINWRQRYDGVADCPDLRDEWHITIYSSEAVDTEFASQRYIESAEYALRHRKFAAMEWIIGISTIIANITAAVTVATYIRKRRKRSVSGKMLNKVMVLSLCISDLLVGVVVTSAAVGDAILSRNKEYWKNDLSWRSSTMCNIIGVVTTLAIQASAFTLCLISLVRLHAIYRPFTIPTIVTIAKCLFAVWLFAFIVSSTPVIPIPALNDNFIYAASLQNLPQLEGAILEKANVSDLMQNIAVLHDLLGKSVCCDATRNFDSMWWYELEQYLTDLNSKLGGWKYFRIYSFTSICYQTSIQTLGKVYGWRHTTTIFALNCFAYLIVLISYTFICKWTTNKFSISLSPPDGKSIATRHTSHDINREKENMKVHKKILILSSTNLICWMPICIQAFIQYSHSENLVSSTSLLITFVLAQVNSLINPFLYSTRLQTILVKLVLALPRRIWSVLNRNKA